MTAFVHRETQFSKLLATSVKRAERQPLPPCGSRRLWKGSVPGVDCLLLPNIHLLLILPDTGLHQPLNQRLAPQVTGHELFKFLLKLLTGVIVARVDSARSSAISSAVRGRSMARNS